MALALDGITFEVTGNRWTSRRHSRSSPKAQGTLLRGEFDFRPKGSLKVIFPLMGPAIRGDLPKQLEASPPSVQGLRSGTYVQAPGNNQDGQGDGTI